MSTSPWLDLDLADPARFLDEHGDLSLGADVLAPTVRERFDSRLAEGAPVAGGRPRHRAARSRAGLGPRQRAGRAALAGGDRRRDDPLARIAPPGRASWPVGGWWRAVRSPTPRPPSPSRWTSWSTPCAARATSPLRSRPCAGSRTRRRRPSHRPRSWDRRPPAPRRCRTCHPRSRQPCGASRGAGQHLSAPAGPARGRRHDGPRGRRVTRSRHRHGPRRPRRRPALGGRTGRRDRLPARPRRRGNRCWPSRARSSATPAGS